MDALDRCTLASLFTPKKIKEDQSEKEFRIGLYRKRLEEGLDLWTGKPLHATELESVGVIE